MPRGATQDRKAFSRQFNPVPAVHASTFNGRTTKISASTTSSPGRPRAITSATRTSAASSTNSMPMSITVSCSLNSRISRKLRAPALPTTAPGHDGGHDARLFHEGVAQLVGGQGQREGEDGLESLGNEPVHPQGHRQQQPAAQAHGSADEQAGPARPGPPRPPSRPRRFPGPPPPPPRPRRR